MTFIHRIELWVLFKFESIQPRLHVVIQQSDYGSRTLQLNREVKSRNIEIAVITETRKKLKGTHYLEDYAMVTRVDWQFRIVVLTFYNWKHNIHGYTYINERIIII